MKEAVEAVIPYLPFRILRKLSLTGRVPARVEKLRGAVLYADVVGFTPLAITLSAQGARGTEALRKALTIHYEHLLRIIRDYGGVVYQFAGDSVLSGFDTLDEQDQEFAPESDEQCALRAVSCAYEIQKKFANQTLYILEENREISMRVGVGFGDYHQILLGESEDWLSPHLIGDAVQEAIAAEQNALESEAMLGPCVADYIKDRFELEEKKGFFLIQKKKTDTKDPVYDFKYEIDLNDIREDFLKDCSRFINPILLDKIHSRRGYFGDFREVTCLFVQLEGVNYSEGIHRSVDRLNQFYNVLKKESENYGGLLNQSDLTDKGDVFLVLFGAPNARENKENLACHLAFKLNERKRDFPFIKKIVIGISTGAGYSGNLGASFRRGYTVVGETINLAARLMALGEDTDIHIDSRTAVRIRENFLLTPMNGVRLKGYAKPLNIFKLESQVNRIRGFLALHSDIIVGREKELKILKKLFSISRDGCGQICQIVGEAGLGKSRLAISFLNEVDEGAAEQLFGACYSYEKFTPFFLWKELLFLFFQIYDFYTPGTRLDRIKKRFEELKIKEVEWIPVVAGILGVDIPEAEKTASLQPRQRNEGLFQIICRLLEKQAWKKPLLIYLEDIHWADELSLKLINYFCSRINAFPALLIIATRPEGLQSVISGWAHAHLLNISELKTEDARIYLRTKLRLKQDLPDFENLILLKTGGNPFFIESIVENLLEQGHIQESQGAFELLSQIDEIKIPNTLRDVLLSRVDRLSEQEQVVLKTASVIGRIFSQDILQELLPLEFTVALETSLEKLKEHFYIRPESGSPGVWTFKHIVIRDTIYYTMLVSRRESLHARLGYILEKKYHQNPREQADIIAYHFMEGAELVKDLEYTLLAANKATERYANKDAAHHFSRAIEILSSSGFENYNFELYKTKENLADVYRKAGRHEEAIGLYKQCLKFRKTRAGQARINYGMGLVYIDRFQPEIALKQLQNAVRLLRGHMPETGFQVFHNLFEQMIVQLLHLMFPWAIRKVLPAQVEEKTMLIYIFESMGKIYFFSDVQKVAYLAFIGMNLSERLRSKYLISRAGAGFAAIMDGMGFHKFSRRYLRRAQKLALELGDLYLRGISLMYNSIHHQYTLNTLRGITATRKAAKIFRRTGDLWELMTVLSSMGMLHFVRGEYIDCEIAFKEVGKIAAQINAARFQGWSLKYITFSRYIQGKRTATEAYQTLEDSLEHALHINDLLGAVVALQFTCQITVLEGDAEKAAIISGETLLCAERYRLILPVTSLAFAEAARAALFACEKNVTNVPRKELLLTARRAIKRARQAGKKLTLLKARAHHVEALYQAGQGKLPRAEKLFEKAIDTLQSTAFKLSPGLGDIYQDAARLLPQRRLEFEEAAKKVYRAHNITRRRSATPDETEKIERSEATLQEVQSDVAESR